MNFNEIYNNLFTIYVIRITKIKFYKIKKIKVLRASKRIAVNDYWDECTQSPYWTKVEIIYVNSILINWKKFKYTREVHIIKWAIIY